MKKKRFFLSMAGLTLIGLGGYLTNFPKFMILAVACIMVGGFIYFSAI